MKTKAQIVQELLEKHQITAEDAVVLLTPEKEVEYIFLPQPSPVPYPVNPYQPFWYADPFPGRVTNEFPTYSVAVN